MQSSPDSSAGERADDRWMVKDSSRTARLGLFEQRGFPRAVLEAIPNPLLVVDAEMRVLLVSGEIVRQPATGFEEGIARCVTGQVLRRQAEDDDPTDSRRRPACSELGQLRRTAEDALSGVTIQRRECELALVDDGVPRRFKLAVSATPFGHNGGRLAVIVFEDIVELGVGQRRTPEHAFAGIVGSSRQMQEVFDLIREVADLATPVLIQGESGTGKELVARAIHDQGARARGPFVAFNCGAIPESLLESELFGHVKGSFTGATRTRKGRFELAHGGTILLDEVADISPAMQVKLLRVLQEGTFEPVGSEHSVHVDVRVISATNKDLRSEVAAGRFREDLFYRLCVVPVTVPPLRDRRDDLSRIAEHVLSEAAADAGRAPLALSSEALEVLMDHDWPGNVRELQNALQYAAIKCKNGQILQQHLPPAVRVRVEHFRPRPTQRHRLSTEAVIGALEETGGNRTEAAKVLGVSRATLYRFLDSLQESPAAGPAGLAGDGVSGAIGQPGEIESADRD